jgi:protein-S-isoprenylcysteine O-methyltransferase Ste14
MLKQAFFTFAIVCLAANIIRTIYEILKHRKSIRPGKVSFILMFTNMLLLWASRFFMCRYDIHRTEFSVLIRLAGIIISSMGVILFITALFTIKTLESYEGDLITSGIYSLTRHPMYLGFIFWLIGFPLVFGATTSFIFSVIFICNVLYWRYLEEKELLERFPGYREYRRKTVF